MHKSLGSTHKVSDSVSGKEQNLHFKRFPAAAPAAAGLGWHWRIRELEEQLEMCRVFAAVSPSG